MCNDCDLSPACDATCKPYWQKFCLICTKQRCAGCTFPRNDITPTGFKAIDPPWHGCNQDCAGCHKQEDEPCRGL